MKTPEEKYLNDPNYHRFVTVIEHMLHTTQFTPTEIREAAMYACIRYELRRIPEWRRTYATMHHEMKEDVVDLDDENPPFTDRYSNPEWW